MNPLLQHDDGFYRSSPPREHFGIHTLPPSVVFFCDAFVLEIEIFELLCILSLFLFKEKVMERFVTILSTVIMLDPHGYNVEPFIILGI